MQKIYFFVLLALAFCSVFPKLTTGQNCTTLSATFNTYESRCAATGSIRVNATGGSGSYKYRTIGPVNSNFTTSDSITGLSAGNYTVIINDIATNCTFTQTNVIVQGSYSDPRFILSGVNVSCDNGNNGIITVKGQQFGRAPFLYSIVAPSPSGIGTINSTGVFPNLPAGDYSIKMTDSCGGIQTRSITVDNYTWWIDSYSFSKVSCDSAAGFIKVIDSRGNISTLGPIPGFMYGVVRYPGDTIWSSKPDFKFNLAGVSTIDVIAKDGCGKIKKGTVTLNFNPVVGANVNINNQTCTTFSASLTNLNNFYKADFCLYDKNNVLIGCNTTGNFNNIPYGSYCITAHDVCPDTLITRCFTTSPPVLSIAKAINIFNKNCTTFSANMTGQLGLTNPTYCIYNSANVEIGCNTSGIFDSLFYGSSYCIKVKDGCRDTTITRCFSAKKPSPNVPSTFTPTYADCKNIRVFIGGDSLYAPQYCLYDSVGVLIRCNTTGVFDSLLVGLHCVRIYDACYDTTITRCFTIGNSVIVNDLNVNISNNACSTFTVKTTSNNLTGANYCLYNQQDSLISCNTTGTFNDVLYGSYCIKAKNDCPDTLFTKCFSAYAPIPSVSKSISIINRTCASFTARVTGLQNLTNPQYCIFDNNNVQLSCNTTGIFNNLAFGNYCIKIINTCYDTTITRCFSASSIPLDITVTTSKSCSYGYATLGINVTGGYLPVNIKIYRPDKSLLFDRNYNSNNINVDSIPGALFGETYKIVATDNCGAKDSATTGVTASMVAHSATVIAQCPSAAWLNGSGKIELTATSNMGLFTVRVIKKNGAALSPELVPNSVTGSVYTFNDLGTGIYIVSYKVNDLCNRYFYDTVSVAPYYYPNLNRSSAYQCDVNGFSVGAVASNGVGPFSYEIIGSTPSFPSITTAPQVNPIFNINNGTNYSLIRLRALDACGNATLGDASILPLANYKIEVDSNCFQSSSTLSVDTIYNSTYAWYKKDKYNSTDSTYLGAGYSVYVPYLSAGDTGTYVCHVTVNTGCVKRTYAHNLNGLCRSILPIKIITIGGKLFNDQAQLNWTNESAPGLKNYILERRNSDNTFNEIGSVTPTRTNRGNSAYKLIDAQPGKGNNFYRVKLVYENNSIAYSNTVMLEKGTTRGRLHCYPNPVNDQLTINFEKSGRHAYRIMLLSMVNQSMWESTIRTGNNNLIQIPRPAAITKGVYTLRCIDLATNEEFTEKVIFL